MVEKAQLFLYEGQRHRQLIIMCFWVQMCNPGSSVYSMCVLLLLLHWSYSAHSIIHVWCVQPHRMLVSFSSCLTSWMSWPWQNWTWALPLLKYLGHRNLPLTTEAREKSITVTYYLYTHTHMHSVTVILTELYTLFSEWSLYSVIQCDSLSLIFDNTT